MRVIDLNSGIPADEYIRNFPGMDIEMVHLSEDDRIRVDSLLLEEEKTAGDMELSIYIAAQIASILKHYPADRVLFRELNGDHAVFQLALEKIFLSDLVGDMELSCLPAED